jgi:hypothetical protein
LRTDRRAAARFSEDGFGEIATWGRRLRVAFKKRMQHRVQGPIIGLRKPFGAV